MRRQVGALWVIGAAVLMACVSDEPSTGTGTDAGTTDAAAGCTTSSDCPASTPTCTAGACTPCSPTQTPSDCATYHSATPVCGAAGSCVECNSLGLDSGVSADCASKPSTPFCGPNDTCVVCLTANDCAPHVCGTDNSCRACQTNAECPAGACGDDGNCVPGDMIAYVDNGNMTATACKGARLGINGKTLASAYCDIPDALGLGAGTKPYVVVVGHGTAAPYSPITVNVSGTLTLIGPGGNASPTAVIGGSLPVPDSSCLLGTPCLVQVTDPSGAPGGVTIDGFEITSSGAGVYAVECSASGAGQSFRLRNSNVHDVHGDGIYNESCDLTIEDNRVSGTDTRAVDDSNSTTPKYVFLRNIFSGGNTDGLSVTADLTFDRNIVANYTIGNGLQVNSGNPFRITNSFFYLNNYGIELSNTGPAPIKIFQFNTVVYNTLAAFNGGSCDGLLESSIITNNGDAPNSISGCTTQNVLTDGTNMPAFANSSDPSNYDFHLGIDTPAKLSANTACCIDKVAATEDAGAPLSDHDYDGTTRPKGAAYDIGAHEAK